MGHRRVRRARARTRARARARTSITTSAADAPSATVTSQPPVELLTTACRAGDETQVLELLERHGQAGLLDALDASGSTPLMAACESGHQEVARLLLHRGAFVDAPAAKGWTALYIASRRGHLSVVAELLSRGANIEAAPVTGSTPLYIASQSGHLSVVIMLLSRGANIEAAHVSGATSLCVASRQGHLPIVAELLSRGANVEAANVDGITPLCIASHQGHLAIVTELLSRGASVEAASVDGVTPLWIASQEGHLAVVTELISRGANVEAANENGITPLCIASQEGHLAIVTELLARGANIEVARVNGATPLFIASQKGHLSVVIELLTRGANIEAENVNGSTPLSIASQKGHLSVVIELLSRRANVEAAHNSGATPLYIASHQGHLAVVTELISRGANVEAAEEDGYTPLCIASQEGHLAIVTELLLRGANIQPATVNGSKPLCLASQEGHLAIVTELLLRGANIEAARVNGATPLCIASQKGHLSVVTELLSRGANIETENVNGATPLCIASGEGHLSVVTELLSQGANIKAAVVDGATPLYLASRQGHLDIVTQLLSRGANVEAAAVNGFTPLCVASQNDRLSVVIELLSRGANIEAVSVDAGTSLYIASQFGHIAIVSELLSRGANVEAARVSGATPLFVASQKGHLSVVIELLSRGANVEAASMSGFTSLTLASQNGHLSVVTELLSRGANVEAAHESGVTPLYIASQEGHLAIVTELLSRGASVKAAMVDGVTSLHIASQKGHLAIVSELLSGGANVEAATVKGATPLCIASQEGHLAIVTELLSRGASVEAATVDGSTSLCIASQNGRLPVVTELLLRGANVEAATVDGSTSLCIASQNGHLPVVTELLARAANVQAASMDGATPLCIASRQGHLAVAMKLLSRGCDEATGMEKPPSLQSLVEVAQVAASSVSSGVEQLEIADAQGCTPVIAAARSGNFDMVQYLLKVGACAHARANDGETILVSAARWRNLNMISRLFELGLLSLKGGSDTPVPLLMATLQTLKNCSPQVHEFQQMWLRLVGRLVSINDRFPESSEQSLDGAAFQFVMTVFNVIRLKAACESSNVFARLVASPTVATRFRDVHTELTYLEQAISTGSFDELRETWESQCESDEMALLHLLRAGIGGLDGNLNSGSEAEGSQLESASLLQYKLRIQGESCSPDLKALLDLSLRTFQDANVKLPLVPEWFIPPYELDVSEAEASSTTRTTFQSKWANAFVMLSLHRLPRDRFMEAVETCFKLSHPNVVKVFGASHIHTPFRAVYENTTSTSLREFLACEENKHMLWQKLFEVARGLKYLADRGIILGSLRCDDIWVGLDGLAKINALNCVASQDESADKQRVRWQSPEELRGESPSIASCVHSLGMCIWESFAGEVPWVGDAEDVVRLKVLYNYRPQLPDGMTPAQSNLLKSMWHLDPSIRPGLSSVVLQLKQFSDQQILEYKFPGEAGDDVRDTRSQELNLQQFVFIELDSTIKEFLKRLAEKSNLCRVPREQVQHILERIYDVYKVLLAQHKRPSDVAVGNYCELLSRLNRFLGSAYRKQSVLLRAKSQRVVLRSNEFHHRLDDLLELLAPQVRHTIHDWKQQQFGVQEDHASGASPGESQASPSRAPPGVATTAPGYGGDAVKIVRFDSDNVNEKFKEFDFAKIDAAAANASTPQLPWLIQTYNLNYDTSNKIGSGSFGDVFMATWQNTPVVIKFMGYEADKDAYSHDMFFHELRVWFPLNHPHVVKLYGACHVGKRFFVCEFVGNGSLDQYLKHGRNSEKSWQLLYQVALGLQHLHENNILHNDLKCDNVLIGMDGDAKLMDFGLSSILNSAEVMVNKKKQGAVHWKSPEYLRGDRLSLASDIYSFGLLILEAMTGETPWGNSTTAFAVRQLLRKGGFPLRPACLADDSHWNLIKMMCASAPAQRVQISFVVDKLHEFGQQQASSQKESSTISPGAP